MLKAYGKGQLIATVRPLAIRLGSICSLTDLAQSFSLIFPSVCSPSTDFPAACNEATPRDAATRIGAAQAATVATTIGARQERRGARPAAAMRHGPLERLRPGSAGP